MIFQRVGWRPNETAAGSSHTIVIPAKAGIHLLLRQRLGSRFRGDDGKLPISQTN
jgi:hypothetical protein